MKSHTKASRKPQARSQSLEDRREFGAVSKAERYLLDSKHPVRSGRRKHGYDAARKMLKRLGDSNPARTLNPLLAV